MPELDDIKYVGRGGLNYDDNLQVFPSEDYRYALNCIQDEAGEYGVITNVKGNQLVNVTFSYNGVNTVIGFCEDKELHALIWFVHNSRNHHSIIRYKIELNLVEFILHDEPVLNFSLTHRINNAGIIGSGWRKMLFWTDNFNPPRKLNIAMAKGYTVCSSTSTTSTYTTTTESTSTTSTSTSSTSTSSTSSTSTSSSTSTTTSLPFCAEFDLVYNAMPDKPPLSIAEIFNEMVEKLVIAHVWEDLDIFDFFATHSVTTSLINWVNPGVCNPSAVNAPSWTQYQGYIGNTVGSKSIRTNYRPRWEGFHYTTNYGSVFEGCATNLDIESELGAFDGANRLRIRSLSGGNFGASVNTFGTSVIDNAGNTSIGYFGATRENDTHITMWENFTGTTVAQNSTNTPTREVYCCGFNDNGVVNEVPKQLRFICIGAFLNATKVKALIKAVEECLEQLGTGLLSWWPTTSTTHTTTSSTSSTTTTGYDFRVKS